MYKCEQLNILNAYLNILGVKHEDASTHLEPIMLFGELKDLSMERIHIYIGDKLYSCINGQGSFGYEQGLIETMGFEDDNEGVTGYQNAKEIIEKVKKELKNNATKK